MPESEPPVHERTISVGGHTYVQKVQYAYDLRKGRNLNSPGACHLRPCPILR